MSDIGDLASELQEAHTTQAIEAVRGCVPDGQEWGPEYCPECDEPIAEGRRRLGFRTCLECAAAKERGG